MAPSPRRWGIDDVLGYAVIPIENAERTLFCNADRLVTLEVSDANSARARTEASFAGPSRDQ